MANPGMHSESTPMHFLDFLKKYGKKYTGADIAFNLDPSKPLSEQARYTRGSVFEAMQLTLTGDISGDKYFQEKIIPRLLDNNSELTSLILDPKFKSDFSGRSRGTPFLADPSAFYKEGLERKLDARELHRQRNKSRPISLTDGKHPLLPDETLKLVSKARDDGKGGRTRDFIKNRDDVILREGAHVEGLGHVDAIKELEKPGATDFLIGDLKAKRGKWTGWNESGWFNLQREGTKGGWEGLVNVAESHVTSHPMLGSDLKAHGTIRPKIYFGIDDQTKVAGAIPRITDYLDEKFGDNPAFSFKVEERLKKTSVPHTLTSDFIVMHAASQEGTERSVLKKTQRDIAKILKEEGAGSLSTELGFDYGLYGLDESGNPLVKNKVIGGSYTQILDMQLEMATRDSKDSPFTKDVIKQLRSVDPESELGKDLARLGILDDLGVTPGTPQGRETVGGAVGKLLDVESSTPAGAIPAPAQQAAAQRKDRLPHSDAAIEHLAERKETEKWQKQVLLELEGKSEPELTLSQTTEYYEKNTSEKQKKKDTELFLDEKRREANLAPEELMLERAETARISKETQEAIRGSKRYEEIIDRWKTKRRGTVADTINPPKAIEAVASETAPSETAPSETAPSETAPSRKNVHENINARAATKTVEASQTRHEKLNRGKSRLGPRPADTAAPTVRSRIDSNPPTIRVNPPSAPRKSSRGHLDFYLDVEASDIGFSHRDKVIKNKRTLEIGRGHSIPRTEGQRLHQKTVGTQILQFYGGTAEQIRDKSQKDVFHKHMELDVDAGIKKKLEANLKFDLLKTDGTLDRSFNTEEIDRIMTGTDLSVDEQKAKKAMSNPAGPQGKFKITSPAVLKNITASRLTNPTAGMFGLGVNLTNHTLNQVLGRSVFESKYGRPNATSSEQFVQEFLNRMVKLEKTARKSGKQARLVAWNMNYDITKMAEQVDIYGKNIRVNFKGKEETAAKVFQDLFIGSDPNQANYLIKSVDAADRLKDMHLWRLIHDNSYNLHSINHKNVAEKLKSGSRTRREIKRAAIEELKSYKTGAKTEFIKTNTALKEFAGDISKYKNSELDENALRNEFYNRITKDQPEFSSADMSRHRKGRVGKVVNQAVKLVKEVSEVDHASGDSMMETVRRNVAALDNIDSTGSILNKIWKITDKTSGIMGFGLNKDIEYAAEGSQTKKILMSMGRLATGHDTVAGYSISAGDGGSLGSFIAAKADYIELHGKPSGGTGLHDVFKTIDDIRKEAHGAAHDASVDTRQMVNQSLNLLDNEYFRGSHGEDTSIQEFRGRYLQYRQEESIKGGIDAYIFEEDFRPSGKGAAGVNVLEDIIPEPQTIANAGDAPARELIDSTEPLAPRSRGIKGRGGVLAGGVLALAGLALIGNRNGGIKHPGSKYNTVEGISPSGDPLIHSFGSGSDNFSSQAITNLKYGTGYGSNTLRSSMLGYRGDRLRDILLGRSSFDDYTNSSEKGTLVHNIVEAEYLKRDIAQSSEHVVHSPELDVMGHIDLVLNSGVPLEIKSVEDFEALERLKSPKEAHISQANFYAYALKQPYALIGYAARNDPTAKIKYFKVNTNIKRLRNDVEAVRAMMSDLQRQGYDVQNYSAYQAMRDVYAKATQNKYQQNAVGMGAGLPSGMMAPPEYSAIKGLGDYGKHIRPRVYRQENRTNLTSTQQFKSKSRIRDQGKHAALHGNSALKYNTRTSHPNGSRQMV